MRFTIPLLFLVFSHSLIAQSDALLQYEADINRYLTAIQEATSDDDRFAIGDSLRETIIDAVNQEGSFDHPFASVKGMGILTSPDKAFRLFNWNIPRNDETHRYFAIVLFGEDEGYRWIELQDQEKEASGVDKKYLTPEKWMGCLYYEIIPMKDKKTKRYTLIGWDGYRKQSTRKIIDVVSFTGGKVRFGANVFKGGKGSKKRVILEYSSEVMVSCKYNKKEKRIVMDHLAPRDPSLTGVYTYYGPDMTFDAYNLEKGKWVLERNVDVRLKRKELSGPFKDPTGN